ncbi:unnamed protein product, partial [Didymodactylos carnosus]
MYPNLGPSAPPPPTSQQLNTPRASQSGQGASTGVSTSLPPQQQHPGQLQNTPYPPSASINSPYPPSTSANSPYPPSTSVNSPYPPSTSVNSPYPPSTSVNAPYPPSTFANTPFAPSAYAPNQQYPGQQHQQNSSYPPGGSMNQPSANSPYSQQQPASYYPGQQNPSSYGSPYSSIGMGAAPNRYPQQNQPPNTNYSQNAPNQGYPPGGSGYPPGGSGYLPGGSGYPPGGSGYPPGGSGYPPGGSGYPPGGSGYPPSQGYPPPQQQGYPPSNPYQPSYYSGAYPGAGPPNYQQTPYGVPPQQQPGGGGPGFGYPGGAFPPQQQQSNYSAPYQQGPRPSFGVGGGNDSRMQRINQIAQKYEINPALESRLRILEGFEIVLLCDDSGSMNTPLEIGTQTRWDEMKQIVNIILDICIIFDSNGVDIYFLNRRPVQNVTNMSQLNECFSSKPQGMTPIVPTLRNILRTKGVQANEGKKLLIFIATDGAPTNDQGQVDIQSLEYVVRNERNPQTTYISFLACTDDNDSVAYLSNWDKQMQNVDVVDDYKTEKQEVQRQRGYQFPFSYGDYIVKALLGAI